MNAKKALLLFLFVSLLGVGFYASKEDQRSSQTTISAPIIELSAEPEQTKQTVNKEEKAPFVVKPVPPRHTPNSKSAELVFPNGEIVSVEYQYYMPDSIPFYPAEHLADMYDALVHEATNNGHAGAARTLARSLSTCSYAPRTQEMHDQALENLFVTGHINIPRGPDEDPVEVDVGADDYEFYRVSITEQYTLCKGITKAQYSRADEWLHKAAELGDFPSLDTLSLRLGDTKESLDSFKEAWDLGFVGAGYAISDRYKKHLDPNMPPQQQDQRAYAYMLAVNMVWSKAITDNGSPNAANKLSDLDSAIAGLSMYLTPQQQQEADGIAASLIRDNDRCCLGNWTAFGTL